MQLPALGTLYKTLLESVEREPVKELYQFHVEGNLKGYPLHPGNLVCPRTGFLACMNKIERTEITVKLEDKIPDLEESEKMTVYYCGWCKHQIGATPSLEHFISKEEYDTDFLERTGQ